MIVACKTLRKAFSSHPFLRYLNSTQANKEKTEEAYKPIKLSPEAQRALWANHFIRTIIREPLTTTIQQSSLTEKLINSPNPISQFQFDQVIKKEMTSIFTEGVYFNTTVFQQGRMTDAINQNQMLTFYPSVFVTTKIFAQLKYKRQSMMFQGSYGIGKTISIAFYIYLTNIINKYVLLAARDKESKSLQEYKYLVQQKHLPIENKKLWYWSINWNLVQAKDFSLQRILAEQATELTQKEREELRKCKTIEEAHQKIRQLYKGADIMHMAVLDQIDHAVSFVKQWNQFVNNNKRLIDQANKNIGSVNQADLNKMNNILYPATQLISLAKQFTAINQFHYVLNSPVYIETELLEEKESKDIESILEQANTYKPLTFQLMIKAKKHSPMVPTLFPFQKQIQTQYGRIRFWQFFLELLKERINMEMLTEQKWKMFKAAFLQYACSQKIKGYYRFLHIRRYLWAYNISNDDIIKWEDIKSAARRMIIDFQAKTIDHFTENIQKFMQYGDIELKKAIISAMFLQASRLSGYYRSESFVVDFQMIGAATGKSHLAQPRKLKQLLLSSEHNTQLIPIQNVENSLKVLVLLSPQDFVNIVESILSPEPYNHQKQVPGQQKRNLKRNPYMRGGPSESQIQDMLVKGATLTFSNVVDQRKLMPNKKHQKRIAPNTKLEKKTQEELQKIIDVSNKDKIA